MSTSATPASPGTGFAEHRSSVGRAGAVIWGVVALLLVADVLRRGHGRAALVSAGILLLLSVAVYALSWRPAVLVTPDAVTLVNPLRTITVPWSAVTSIGGQWSLEVRTGRGTYTAWVSGPRSRRRAHQEDPLRLSNQLIARWEQREFDRSRSRVPDEHVGEPVVQWDVPALALGSVLVVALVAAALL